jgi:hypothetical protein
MHKKKRDGTHKKYHPVVFSLARMPHGTLLLSMMLVTDGELLTTLCAARSQHAATVLGGHTLAETMLVHAAAIVRLKCSFHCNDSLFISTNFLKSLDFGLQNY